jgi:hypothetical protein
MKILIPICVMLALSACGGTTKTAEQRYARNDYALRNPTLVGVTPDGQKIMHAQIDPGGIYYHEIYWVGQVTTNNTRTSSGKSSKPEVAVTLTPLEVVMIDGQPVEVNAIREMLNKQREER